VWADLNASLIENSFQYYGLTSRNIAEYSNQLRDFIQTTELVDEVQLDDDQTNHNYFSDSDKEEFYQVEDAILDSESDLNEHED